MPQELCYIAFNLHVGPSIKTHNKIGQLNLFILDKICTMFQFGKGVTGKGDKTL